MITETNHPDANFIIKKTAAAIQPILEQSTRASMTLEWIKYCITELLTVHLHKYGAEVPLHQILSEAMVNIETDKNLHKETLDKITAAGEIYSIEIENLEKEIIAILKSLIEKEISLVEKLAEHSESCNFFEVLRFLFLFYFHCIYICRRAK